MIKTAVITGHHEYDVVGLHQFLRTLEGIDAYPQNLEDFATDMGSPLSFYDVVVFYNYHLSTPSSTGSDLDHAIEQVLHKLIHSETGILLLHHGIVGYQQWDMWDALAGMGNRITVPSLDGLSPRLVSASKAFSIAGIRFASQGLIAKRRGSGTLMVDIWLSGVILP